MIINSSQCGVCGMVIAKKSFIVTAALAMLLIVASCGEGTTQSDVSSESTSVPTSSASTSDSSSDSSSTVVNVAGIWMGSFKNSRGYQNGLSVHFNQDATTVSGQLTFRFSACFGVMRVTGTVTGQEIEFSSFDLITFQGSIADSVMSGTYAISDAVSGSTCSGMVGTFVLRK